MLIALSLLRPQDRSPVEDAEGRSRRPGRLLADEAIVGEAPRINNSLIRNDISCLFGAKLAAFCNKATRQVAPSARGWLNQCGKAEAPIAEMPVRGDIERDCPMRARSRKCAKKSFESAHCAYAKLKKV